MSMRERTLAQIATLANMQLQAGERPIDVVREAIERAWNFGKIDGAVEASERHQENLKKVIDGVGEKHDD